MTKQSRSILAILSTDIAGYTKATEESLLSVLHNDPYNPKTYYELSILYSDWSKIEKAREHMEIPINIWKDANPEYIFAKKAREKFKTL